MMYINLLICFEECLCDDDVTLCTDTEILVFSVLGPSQRIQSRSAMLMPVMKDDEDLLQTRH